MWKRVFYTFLIVLFIGCATLAVISYGRGYRFNFNDKKVLGTGILSVSSYPEKSSIIIDGKLTSASNASITLSPGWYNVKISKEGYQSWDKRVRIQAEVVTQIDALLIPANPSLRTLTVTSILNPSLSPSSTKVAYIIPQSEATASSTLLTPKNGIWILDLRTGTLGGKNEPKQIFRTDISYDWKNAKLVWSPDEKQIIMTINKKSYSFSTDITQTIASDVTSTLPSILFEWKATSDEKRAVQLEALPASVSRLLLNSSSDISFSPDETKILYHATSSAVLQPVITPPLIGSNPTEEVRKIEAGKYYVYDTKEDKNFLITDNKTISKASSLLWYTDSKHIIIIEKDTISIIDYDGTNKRAIYSGHFEDSIVYPWASGGKLVILTNLNKPQSLPNLYELDLR